MTEGREPPENRFGPWMRSAITFANYAGGTLAAAEKRRAARIAGKEPPSPKRSPLEASLADAGLEIPNVEEVLARMLGNTPEARARASMLVSHSDAAQIFQDFVNNCNAWAPSTPQGESAAPPADPAASSPPTGESASAPPPADQESPFFRPPPAHHQGPVHRPSGAAPSGHTPQPGAAWSGAAPHAAPTAARSTHAPGHTPHAAAVAAWPAFRADLVPHAPAAPPAGARVQPVYAHAAGSPGGQPRYREHPAPSPDQTASRPSPPPEVSSHSKPRPGWGGIGRLPTRPRAAASAKTQGEEATTSCAASAEPKGSQAPAAPRCPVEDTSPNPAEEISRGDAVPAALLEWMKAKVEAIERDRAAELAELAALRRSVADVLERLGRIERKVESFASQAKPTSSSSAGDVDDHAAEEASRVDTTDAEPAATSDADTCQAPELEIAVPVADTVTEPIVEDQVTIDTDDAAQVEGCDTVTEPIVEEATIVDTDREPIEIAEHAATADTDAAPSLDFTALSLADHIEESASAASIVTSTVEVVSSHPAITEGETSDPGLGVVMPPVEETATTIVANPSDDPPGPIPPELEQRIQLLKQQSEEVAARRMEISSLADVTKRTLAKLSSSDE